MNEIPTTYLALSWSVSRGRDTYGYNICRLDVEHGGKRYRCNRGGYDMVGTVVADWLCGTYQERLQTLAMRVASVKRTYDRIHGCRLWQCCSTAVGASMNTESLYGPTFKGLRPKKILPSYLAGNV